MRRAQQTRSATSELRSVADATPHGLSACTGRHSTQTQTGLHYHHR